MRDYVRLFIYLTSLGDVLIGLTLLTMFTIGAPTWCGFLGWLCVVGGCAVAFMVYSYTGDEVPT